MGALRQTVCAVVLLSSWPAWGQTSAAFGDRVAAQAEQEVRERAADYALTAGIRLPWREGGFAVDEWKCNSSP